MKVVCFGDSNTFGFDPRSYTGDRYPADARWVDLLAKETGWDVRNNGMNGREIPRRETVFSKSTDVLVVMLGTNDLLQGNSVECITHRMERFVELLTIEREKILLVAPPPLCRGAWVENQSLIDASSALGTALGSLAERIGVHFSDAGTWGIALAYDGVHFTEDGNQIFAKEICHRLKEITSK